MPPGGAYLPCSLFSIPVCTFTVKHTQMSGSGLKPYIRLARSLHSKKLYQWCRYTSSLGVSHPSPLPAEIEMSSFPDGEGDMDASNNICTFTFSLIHSNAKRGRKERIPSATNKDDEEYAVSISFTFQGQM